MSTIYLLAILDGVSGTFEFFACITAIGAGGYILFSLLATFDGREEVSEKAARTGKMLFAACIACAVAATFIPTRREVAEAYLMIEAPKIANASNVDKALEWADKRLDQILAPREVAR